MISELTIKGHSVSNVRLNVFIIVFHQVFILVFDDLGVWIMSVAKDDEFRELTG